MDQLSELKKMTTVVIDTGEIDEIARYKPVDATTNPSLLLSATKNPAYSHLLKDAVKYVETLSISSTEDATTALMEKLFVNFGVEILKHIPGRISTEVDPRYSFDVKGSIAKARHFIELYEAQNIDRKRVLIKLASTWEGIQAAKELEKEGIHCNMTLLFSLTQAIACAEAGVTLVSPFVGRILDWHKKNGLERVNTPSEDPGVQSVTAIYNYFKQFGYTTQVMGASFRNVEEIVELAGCDLLTISPDLLKQLESRQGPLERKLDPKAAVKMTMTRRSIDENSFRYEVNDDAMACEKLAEGIRKFAKDAAALREMLKQQLSLAHGKKTSCC